MIIAKLPCRNTAIAPWLRCQSIWDEGFEVEQVTSLWIIFHQPRLFQISNRVNGALKGIQIAPSVAKECKKCQYMSIYVNIGIHVNKTRMGWIRVWHNEIHTYYGLELGPCFSTAQLFAQVSVKLEKGKARRDNGNYGFLIWYPNPRTWRRGCCNRPGSMKKTRKLVLQICESFAMCHAPVIHGTCKHTSLSFETKKLYSHYSLHSTS